MRSLVRWLVVPTAPTRPTVSQLLQRLLPRGHSLADEEKHMAHDIIDIAILDRRSHDDRETPILHLGRRDLCASQTRTARKAFAKIFLISLRVPYC